MQHGDHERRIAGLFADALGERRDDAGRSSERLRIGAMAAAVAVVLAVTAGGAAWPAVRAALTHRDAGTAGLPALHAPADSPPAI
ncbi:MAG TPA: hypothetical protein VOB72_02395, partial [Candidatus Dormibacteraeota bacterium]|nr:hypothetical protein [Candidatus Dormibacteraeota bacterium]